ncbi:hypothetical protein DYB36_013930 [Aphanomyces astaci]|uniref:Uncharacterized protein n=1 Tax=Aphanomyces astaci TaxID=112090 RepID=A0A397A059_APHAT|nr:hypothetical protein DYB36_013930 [Aphanomyces astaci]
MDIRWDFELQDEMVSTVACAVAFHWALPRPARASDIEKHVIAGRYLVHA